MRGKFIVFEGPDGSGKSTQLRLFSEYLTERGIAHECEREPTGDTLGLMVRRVLSGELDYEPETLALLFSADRREHIKRMRSALQGGLHVLCDRYVYSSIAYQGLALTPERVCEINRENIENLLADVVVYIDLPTEKCMERIAKNRDSTEIFETSERIARVRENYEIAFERLDPAVLLRIDGSGTPEEVFEQIKSKLII